MIKNKIRSILKNNNVFIDNDIFDYGFTILVTYLMYLLFIIPIALILSELFEVLLFIILFIPLRRYIGGFHFNNQYYCFIVSITLALILPYIVIRIVLPLSAIITIVIFTYIITYKIGVIDHYNKVLNEKEKHLYQKKSFYIITIYLIILCTSRFFQFYYISQIITFIFIFNNISLIISNHWKKCYNKKGKKR